MTKEEYSIVLVREDYFKKYNSSFVEMLDPTDTEKQSRRMYIYLKILINENNVLVPLRTNLRQHLESYGNIGYLVPSSSKPNAGFDYRKILIINEDKYITNITELNIPSSQKNIINKNYNTIVNQVKQYIKGYIKSFNKNRHLSDKKFKFSTLHNFHKELCLLQKTT